MKRLIAAIAAAALVGTGAAIAVAGPAEAHTGDLIVKATCVAETGQYNVSATLNITQTGLAGETKFKVGNETFEGTPSSDSGLTGGPIASQGAGTIALTSFTLPGDTKGFGPWVYAFTKWSDKYSKGSDGRLTTPLAGDCSIPTPPTVSEPRIQDYLPGTTCPAEGETRTAAFVADNTGSNVDVTYTINGVEYLVKAGEARHIDGLQVADAGTHFTITAADQKWEFDAPAVDCPPVVVPPTVISALPPQFHDICGIEGDEVQVPTGVEHVTYTTDDRRKDGVGVVEITATADEGYVLNENGDTTQTWGHEFTNEPCDSGTTPPPTTEPTPPVTPTPTPTETPTTEPKPTDKPTHTVTVPKPTKTPEAAAPVVKGDDNGPTTLAYTGSEGLVQGGIAAGILVLLGLGLAFAVRKSRTN